MMTVEVLFFGELIEITKENKIDVENTLTLDQLKCFLHQKFPELKEKQYQIAVNAEIDTNMTDLKSGDKIAFLPPFSGG